MRGARGRALHAPAYRRDHSRARRRRPPCGGSSHPRTCNVRIADGHVNGAAPACTAVCSTRPWSPTTTAATVRCPPPPRPPGRREPLEHARLGTATPRDGLVRRARGSQAPATADDAPSNSAAGRAATAWWPGSRCASPRPAAARRHPGRGAGDAVRASSAAAASASSCRDRRQPPGRRRYLSGRALGLGRRQHAAERIPSPVQPFLTQPASRLRSGSVDRVEEDDDVAGTPSAALRTGPGRQRWQAGATPCAVRRCPAAPTAPRSSAAGPQRSPAAPPLAARPREAVQAAGLSQPRRACSRRRRPGRKPAAKRDPLSAGLNVGPRRAAASPPHAAVARATSAPGRPAAGRPRLRPPRANQRASAASHHRSLPRWPNSASSWARCCGSAGGSMSTAALVVASPSSRHHRGGAGLSLPASISYR